MGGRGLRQTPDELRGFVAVYRIGPHCMKMIGCWPSRRIGVAVRPSTYLALARFRILSKDTAPT
jgi:hypothetical protein